MDISSLIGLTQINPYKTGLKQADTPVTGKFEFATASDKNPANFADDGKKVTGKTVTNNQTASTLWETQAYAQSPESKAVDIEPETIQVKSKSDADKFLEFMNKTPEEKMREAVLKELGYTEEQLASMSPQDRAKAEAKIKDTIEKKIEEAMRKEGVDIDGANHVAETSKSISALV